MRRIVTTGFIVAALSSGGAARAYGGGGGGSGCAEPKFFEPAPQGTVASLNQFAFVASDNTEISTLQVDIDGRTLQPQVERRRSGDFEAKVALPEPITRAGKLRIAVKAKSRDGCWGFQPYSIEIAP